MTNLVKWWSLKDNFFFNFRVTRACCFVKNKTSGTYSVKQRESLPLKIVKSEYKYYLSYCFYNNISNLTGKINAGNGSSRKLFYKLRNADEIT